MNLIQLLNKITVAPNLDFGSIFGDSIELFKKTWGDGILMLLINIVLILPVFLILYLPIIAAAASGISDSEISSGELSPIYMVSFGLLCIPVFALIQTISIGLTAGFYRLVKEKDLGELNKSANLFMFLKKEYLKKLFLLSLMSIGIAVVAALLCYLPVFYVAIPLGLIPVILAFNPELTATEILKASFKLGNKKWLLLFGLVIVASLLSQLVGLLLCGIGILFTASFVYLPYYVVYKQSVGFEDSDKISQIETEAF